MYVTKEGARRHNSAIGRAIQEHNKIIHILSEQKKDR